MTPPSGTPIELLRLPARCYNALLASNVETVEQLRKTDYRLLRGIGMNGCREIKEALERFPLPAISVSEPLQAAQALIKPEQGTVRLLPPGNDLREVSLRVTKGKPYPITLGVGSPWVVILSPDHVYAVDPPSQQ